MKVTVCRVGPFTALFITKNSFFFNVKSWSAHYYSTLRTLNPNPLQLNENFPQKTENLDANYVTGFADAESTFIVSVIKNKKCSTG